MFGPLILVFAFLLIGGYILKKVLKTILKIIKNDIENFG